METRIAIKCNGFQRTDGGDQEGHLFGAKQFLDTPFGRFTFNSDGLIIMPQIMEIHVYTCLQPRGHLFPQPDFVFQAVSAKISPGRQALVIVIPNIGSIGISWDINNSIWYP